LTVASCQGLFREGLCPEIGGQRKITTETPVREIMTHDVITIGPGDTIERCLALMTAKRIRHLPVLDKSELVGVISIGDAVKAQISEQESMIGDLERYISGKRA
jgi:CBS domain-containing protein